MYLIAALFTIAKTWKQYKSPLMIDWVRKNVIHTQTHTHIHNVCMYILFSHKKEKSCYLQQYEWTLRALC